MTEWIWKDKEGNEISREEIPDISVRSDEDVLTIDIRPDDIHHSDFPHPLVTVDYAEDGGIVAITFVGPMKRIIEEHTIEAVAAWLEKGAPVAAKWVRHDFPRKPST